MKSQESDSSDLVRLEDQEEMRDEMLEETKGMGSDFSAYGLYCIELLIHSIWTIFNTFNSNESLFINHQK